MKLTIDEKSKQEVFIAIFQLLKNWGSFVNMNFESDKMFIQTMDKSHICLADIFVSSSWFSTYKCDTPCRISVDSSSFALLMSCGLKHDSIELIFDDTDKLYINLFDVKEKKEIFNHYYELRLGEVDEEKLGIPEVEYDVDMQIETKKLADVLSELAAIGPDLNVKCSEDAVELIASGNTCNLRVVMDDISEFAITEGAKIDVSFSLSHVHKMCVSTKISGMVSVSISNEYPIIFKYDLGDGCKATFYVAPKISDN
jgi:proliferating cell nuclear antigen